MAQVTFILAVVGFALAAGVAGFLWRRGFFGTGITTTPRVQMPWLMISGDVNTTRACGDKAFDGEVDVLLLYGFPPPPLAEVKVEIEIRDRKDVTVSLDQTDLGTFRNDMWKTVRFSGERTKPCDGGKFVVAGTAVSTGPGATTIADADVVRVDALDQVVKMPIHVSTSNGIDFDLDIIINCCGRGNRHRVFFANAVGVNSLEARPNRFRCGSATDVDTINIRGKKNEENTVGAVTVKARAAGGECVLGNVLVE